MNRGYLLAMKDNYFASMQAFFAEHEGTDLEDAEGLWGFLAVSALHHACCQELLLTSKEEPRKRQLCIAEALQSARKVSAKMADPLDQDLWNLISALEILVIEGGAS